MPSIVARSTAIALAALGLLGAAARADAVPVPYDNPDSNSSSGSLHCWMPAWKTQPRIVIHTSNFDDTTYALSDMYDAVTHVADGFAHTTGAAVKIAGVSETSADLDWNTQVKDSVPTIHVRFVSDAKITADNDGKGANGLTKPWFTQDNCTILEAHIEFPRPSEQDWNYGTPFTEPGAKWYDAGPDYAGAGKDGTWFRPSFLHELLHAYGLKHTKTMYAFMDHRGSGGFPWANRDPDLALRPLPYDTDILQALYTEKGDSWDVAVLNTWFAPPEPGDSAANQVANCTPSVGDKWSPDGSDGSCATGGDTTVCAGDMLKTRFTLANYSTGSMRVTATLYLSRGDAKWHGDEPASETTHSLDFLPTQAQSWQASWKVPALTSGASYRPIVRVIAEHIRDDGSADPDSVVADWIPLRGNVTAGGLAACGAVSYVPAGV